MSTKKLDAPTIVFALACLHASLGSVAAAQNLVLLSNLGEPESVAVIGFNNIVIEAQSFITGPVATTPAEMLARLSANAGTTFFGQLRADQNDRPGSLIGVPGTFAVVTTGEQTVHIPLGGSPVLQPFTQYWLVVGTTAGPGANWHITTSHNGSSPVGWIPGVRTQSNDAGVAWLPPRSDVVQLFAVAGSLVPEPGTLVLACLGLLAIERKCRRSRVIRAGSDGVVAGRGSAMTRSI